MSAPRTIAVGYDGSLDAFAALRWAAELASDVHAHLIIVHAEGLLEEAGLSGRPVPDGSAALAIAAQHGLSPSRAKWLVYEGDPCSALLRAVDPPHSVDLLVVGTRGVGRHSGTVLGSTSLELAERAKVPLAIVPTERLGSEGDY